MNESLHELRLKVVGFFELVRRLGPVDALRFGLRSETMTDPFETLGPPENENDRLSRDQIRSAVKLYSLLREAFGQTKALDVMEKVIVRATLVHLQKTIGPLDIPNYLASNQTERQKTIESLTSRFFNATSVLDSVEETGFVYRVTACRFVPLCQKAGVPELAPLFCKGDLAFFASGPVELKRPGTLAEGAPNCRFEFSLRKQ